MAYYNPTKIFDMIIISGECQTNLEAAALLYAQRSPNSRHPCRKAIRNSTARVREGQVVRVRRRCKYDENDLRPSQFLHLCRWILRLEL